MKTKIIYIDDDKFLLNMYKIKFDKITDYDFVTIEKLEADYLTQIADLKPDLILSDYVRPKPDGLEVLEALKKDDRTRNIPFVFLTTSVTPTVIKEARKNGVVAVISKADTNPQEVVERVTKIMDDLKENKPICTKVREELSLKKFTPDALFLLGVLILSISLFRKPIVNTGGLPKPPSFSQTDYFTGYKVLGVMLIAVSIVIAIRYILKIKK